MLIPETKNTPSVVAALNENIISIKGKITPENPDEFFNQLEILTKKCIAQSSKTLQLNLSLEYFNTPSSKMLAKYLKSIIQNKPIINWYFEEGDEELKEAGEDYAILIDYKINLIEFKYS